MLNATLSLKEALSSPDQTQLAFALTRELVDQTLAHASLIWENEKNLPSEAQEKIRSERMTQLNHVLQSLVGRTFETTVPFDGPTQKRLIDDALKNYLFPEEMAGFYARLGHIQQIAGLVARDNLFTGMLTRGLTVAGGVTELVNDKKRFTSAKKAVEMLSKPVFGLTLTAHPTNVNGLASIKAQRALTQAIDDVRAGRADNRAVSEAMGAFVRTPLTHHKDGAQAALTVRDDAEQMLNALGNVYDDLPHIYDRFDKPLASRFADYKPEQLALGIDISSWGSSGDKDGNSNVTADTTLEAIIQHKHMVFTRYKEALSSIESPLLAPWKARIDKALEATTFAATLCERYRPHLDNDAWTKATAALKENTNLDTKAFVRDLERTYATTRDKPTLDLLRRVRIFGFGMGRIEYRETADIYGQISGLFIKDYATMSEAKRVKALNALLAMPLDSLRLEHQETLARIGASGNKPYSDTDALPIAHHTLKRMELARDFPDMVKDNVLAECQNTSNFLEALLMQRLAEKDGKKPNLGIVPLFEEYRVLERAGSIMHDALTNPHYRSHVDALAARNNGHATQQVQLAHSDNARRAGMPAARAYIYEAHSVLREAIEKEGIKVQFFEGGSQSDPYRGGVRSMTASANEFGIHDFAKFTFQGGDLLNYLNYPSSSIRLFTRNIAHAADVMERKLMRQDTKKDRDPVLDAAATNALKRTARDYEEKIFHNPQFGDFLKDIGYLEETEAGNKTSRPAKRGSGSTDTVDVEKTRTIAFSEAFQHAGICPTWIGSQNLYTYLCRELKKPLDATDLHTLYKKSPVFTDVVDRMLFGLAKTDLTEMAKSVGDSRMFQTLALEYRYAFALAMEAKTGIAYPDRAVSGTSYGNASFKTLRNTVVKEGLPHLSPTLEANQRYMEQVEQMKRILTFHKNGDADAAEKHLRVLLHSAGDTVHHGRILPADDHTYGQLLLAYQEALKSNSKTAFEDAHASYEVTRNNGATHKTGRGA